MGRVNDTDGCRYQGYASDTYWWTLAPAGIDRMVSSKSEVISISVTEIVYYC